jgi:hypothetical protein
MAVFEGRLYNSHMTGRRGWIAAGLLGLAVAGCTLLPYLLAERAVTLPDAFAGFLLNPLDGFSYLAKMRQGADGSWLFTLPYGLEPGPGAFLFVYHLLLGHLARWLTLPLLTVYHSARILGAVAMYLAGWGFFSVVLRNRRARWAAFALTLVGSGIGWLLLPLGIVSPDLWVPEAIPFLSAYTNAHFALATAALLCGVVAVAVCVLQRRAAVHWLAIAGLCGLALGAIQPFAALCALMILSAWLLWEAGLALRRSRAGLQSLRPGLAALSALALGSMPWAAYDWWITRTDPALAAWSSQNLTPSPPPLEFAAAYGIVLLLAIANLVRSHPARHPTDRLLVAWVVVNALLLYAPFGLQRRLALGLFFPLAALAARTVVGLAGGRLHLRGVLAIALVVSIPSNLVVVGAGLTGVQRSDPTLILSAGEAGAYRWLAEKAEAEAVVLASPFSGARLPAFANVRVLVGHPFETPQATEQRRLVEDLYAWDGDPETGVGQLVSLGIDYVLFGEPESQLGDPAWLPLLTPTYAQADTRLFRVADP